MFRSIRVITLSLAFVLLWSSSALAAGTVGTGTPGSCTEAALDTALSGGGLVDFDCGGAAHTITLTSNKAISATTTIDGGGLITIDGDSTYRIFQVTLANDFTVQNITLQNGDGTGIGGGAIDMGTGILTVTNSTIQNNISTLAGGAIGASSGDVNITNSTFTGNSTTSSAGVLFVTGGTITINGSTFDQNSSGNGGGVLRIDNGTVNITDSIFTGNSTTGGNGVALQINSGTVTVQRSIFENNTLEDRPVIENGGTLILSRVAIVNNSGIGLSSSGTASLTNTTIGDNTSSANFGGGIYVFATGTVDIINGTITNNNPRGVTGGGNAVNIRNTVIAGNSFDCVGTITSLDGNVDGDGSCGLGQASDLSSTNPMLDALSTVPHDDVSGNTRVYQPQTGSPLIDSGVAVANPPTDQRGVSRPMDGDNNMTQIIDRGAFEVAPAIDITAPVLAEVSPVATPTTDTTPSYTFSSDEAGTITYGGDCSGATTAAVAGNNTISFNTLAANVYSNCTITVTDAAANASTPLAVTSFEVVDPNSSNGGNSGGGAGGSLTPPPNNNQNPQPVEHCGGYTDISANDPDCEAIEYAQSIGAMTGNDDGTFAPSESLQRDQIAKISLEAFGLFDDQADYCENTNPFPDITASDWSYQYVCRGKQLGMITGYKDGENAGLFVPANKVMIVEFWALILRNTTESLPLGESFSGWVTDAWYSGYAKFVADNNLYDGLSPSPTETVPRRDVAVFLYELHQMEVL
ncbi:MAG: choice-of-anchor Q domain-containing protein [Candidatus Gracilibacteria bacterium]|nr:S-layer homology domain-containing protein [Candidatus Peregrinibacteria bacterium]